MAKREAKKKRHWSDVFDGADPYPCEKARRWMQKFKTPQAAWNACTNPYWMWWAAYDFDELMSEKIYRLLNTWIDDRTDRKACDAIRRRFPKPPRGRK